MLQLVVILKALAEVAICAFLGQGILYVLAGSKRESNFVYVMFKTLTSPVMRLARLLSPRVVLDRHIWLVACFLLLAMWIALTIAKVNLVIARP
jgi:hypothetical protein